MHAHASIFLSPGLAWPGLAPPAPLLDPLLQKDLLCDVRARVAKDEGGEMKPSTHLLSPLPFSGGDGGGIKLLFRVWPLLRRGGPYSVSMFRHEREVCKEVHVSGRQ